MGKIVTWAYLERKTKLAKELRSIMTGNKKTQTPEETVKAFKLAKKKKSK